jgi:transcriptional regulator with XRE-family HTH domain
MIIERLTKLRKDKRWSLQYTADRLGIAKSTYAGYESGYRRPSLEAVKSIADLFYTSVDYILGRVDHPGFQTEKDKLKPGHLGELTNLPDLALAVDGISLSKEEIRQFTAFIRAKRELEG